MRKGLRYLENRVHARNINFLEFKFHIWMSNIVELVKQRSKCHVNKTSLLRHRRCSEKFMRDHKKSTKRPQCHLPNRNQYFLIFVRLYDGPIDFCYEKIHEAKHIDAANRVPSESIVRR